MMKEYLCSNFQAEQILNEVAPSHSQSRLGYAAATTSNSTEANRKVSRSIKTSDIQDSMRYDQGSSEYNDWLTKTATMNDIYRHIMTSLPPSSNHSVISSTLLTNELARRQNKNDENEYEEGDVTGYAMQHPGVMLQNANDGLPLHMHPMLENLHSHHTHSVNHVAGNKIEYPSDLFNQNQLSIDVEQSNLMLYNQFLEQMKATHYHTNNGVHPFTHLKEKFKKIFSRHKYEPQQDQKGYEHYGDTSYDKGSKELGLKDLFDIALTTLAFLSFGMFILQTKPDTGMMMMPMVDGGATDGGDGDGAELLIDASREEVRRNRHSAEPFPLVRMNELSRKILLSIDAVQIADKDNGKCLRNAICENNKYSREWKDNQRVWIPVWGLGLSWLSSKLDPKKSYTSILESLKAAAFGLA